MTKVFIILILSCCAFADPIKNGSDPRADQYFWATNEIEDNLLKYLDTNCQSYQSVPERVTEICHWITVSRSLVKLRASAESGELGFSGAPTIDIKTSLLRGLYDLHYDFTQEQAQPTIWIAKIIIHELAARTGFEKTIELMRKWHVGGTYVAEQFYWPAIYAKLRPGFKFTLPLKAALRLECKSTYFSCYSWHGLTDDEFAMSLSALDARMAKIIEYLSQREVTRFGSLLKLRLQLFGMLKTEEEKGLLPSVAIQELLNDGQKTRQITQMLERVNQNFIGLPESELMTQFLAIGDIYDLFELIRELKKHRTLPVADKAVVAKVRSVEPRIDVAFTAVESLYKKIQDEIEQERPGK